MKKLCGYDLNGWRDTAFRNWNILPGEEIKFGRFSSESGLKPVIVKSGDEKTGKWIGGPQANIAPHGLGDGWGEIGKLDRRRAVLEILDQDRDASKDLLGASLEGLAKNADFGVVGIEDLTTTTELFQERLLGGLSAAKVGSKLLVWRPVLAALQFIELGYSDENTSVGIISHSAEGFSVQNLRIRKTECRGQSILAPERRNYGSLVKSKLGYNGLWNIARKAVAEKLENVRFLDPELIKSTPKLALGFECKTELLKKRTGDWIKLDPPQTISLDSSDLVLGSFDNIKNCDVILLETLCTGPVRSFLKDTFSTLFPRKIILLEEASVAEGALCAAERFSNGCPVYFDFLPQISTIIQSKDGAENFDLINEGETVAAGQLYKSKDPATFGIQSRQSNLTVYLLKENEKWPRKATISLGSEVQEPTPIDLSIEQRPASGRAKLQLNSAVLGRHFSIDWDKAEEVEKDWGSLIEELGGFYPSVPTRLVLPNGLFSWEESMRSDGLFNILEQNVDRDKPDWETLANQLSARPFKKYAISSDGKIPKNIPHEAVEQLKKLTERAVDLLQKRIDGEIKTDNHSLKFLTWQFRNCPQKVTEWLLDCATRKSLGKAHPFAPKKANDVLIYQGLGRTSKTKEMEQAVLNLILKKPLDKWQWRIETACLAFLLSRSETAPSLLTRTDVEHISKRVVFEFRQAIGGTYTTFNYAPFLLVGLLRWRIVEPNALVVGEDKIATKFGQCVEKTIQDLSARRYSSAQMEQAHSRYVTILEDILSELEGEGRNPDLLFDIYNM